MKLHCLLSQPSIAWYRRPRPKSIPRPEERSLSLWWLELITKKLRQIMQTTGPLVPNTSRARRRVVDMASIARQKGTNYHLVARHGFPSGYNEYIGTLPMEPGRGSATGRVLLEGKPVHIIDALTDPEYTLVEAQKRAGFRTLLAVPLLRQGTPIFLNVIGQAHRW
jgi:two-component system NtrC family sensor kinase